MGCGSGWRVWAFDLRDSSCAKNRRVPMGTRLFAKSHLDSGCLLDLDHRVECALIIGYCVRVLRISTPSAVDDELVLVGAGRQCNRGGVDAVGRLVGHFLGGRVPLVELAGEIDLLALFGVNRESDGLLVRRLRGLLGAGLASCALFDDGLGDR